MAEVERTPGACAGEVRKSQSKGGSDGPFTACVFIDRPLPGRGKYRWNREGDGLVLEMWDTGRDAPDPADLEVALGQEQEERLRELAHLGRLIHVQGASGWSLRLNTPAV